jgi:phosphoribosylaminoimidazole-succinocarboxamide synthase
MVSEGQIKEQLKHTLDKTDLKIGKKYEGKVRDNYTFNGKRLIITTDRISAFDRVLCTIPFKGQVLTQTAAFWFEKTKHIVDNHLIKVLDPNVLLAKECMLIPVEMVVRGYLTGSTKTSVLHNYEKGVRDYCGNKLPDGLVKNQKFDVSIITPTTKAEKGKHDEPISKDEIIKQKLVDKDIYEKMEKVSLQLYNFGNEFVGKNNLILVDTKYEFGLDSEGNLTLIDEAHTPDSSRFWIKETYDEKFSKGDDPDKLDKEYVRQYLADKGFLGDGAIPEIPDDVKIETAKRYIRAYEMITGEEFEGEVDEVDSRIKSNIKKAGV